MTEQGYNISERVFFVMKKTNKIIALILAMVLAFSSVPLMASAAAIKDEVNTVEKLIQGESLGDLVEWLLKNLNTRKEEILGTVLSLVYTFVEDDDLETVIGETDPTSASDEELATILVNWLDTYVLPNIDMDDTLEGVLGVFGIKLGSTNQLIDSLYNLRTLRLGDLKFKCDALKGIDTGKGKNLNALYAVLQFLADNTSVFKKAAKADLSFGFTIDLALKAFDFDINKEIKNAIGPDAIKEMLCDAVELDYEAYKKYTADEIVAVAFLKLLTGQDTVSKEDAAKLMELSIYGFLETYAAQIYTNLLVHPLNNDIKDLLVEKVKPLDDEYDNILDSVFNWDYEFKEDTFDKVLGAGKGNMVAQLNDAVITLLEVILTKDAFKKLDLKKGGNENLNENLTKTFRFILPKLAKLDNLGADLSAFTSKKVKDMDAEDMAVEVLKLFFPGWFDNAKAKDVAAVKTLEQLAVLAAKYAVTNDEWVPMEIKAAAKATKVEKLSDEKCLEIIFEIGMETAAKALNYNKGTTCYELPEDTSKWTAYDYLDDIVDWALNFADGLPASADLLTTERGVIDGEGGFFKLNVVLDSIIDLSFFTGCGNDQFAFDFETMLMDQFLGNLLNFDIEASVAMLAANEESSLFDKKINVAAIDLVDDLLTGLFEEGYEIPATFDIGDVDADGTISATDARLALRASVNLEQLTANQTKAADADKDGTVAAADARLILRASVGLETLA